MQQEGLVRSFMGIGVGCKFRRQPPEKKGLKIVAWLFVTAYIQLSISYDFHLLGM